MKNISHFYQLPHGYVSENHEDEENPGYGAATEAVALPGKKGGYEDVDGIEVEEIFFEFVAVLYL